MITVDGGDLSPALLSTLKHAASMANPLFYERQRRRASTWAIPRFLRSYDETVTGDLILPRGLLDRLTTLVEEAGSHLELADERSQGDHHVFEPKATLYPEQQEAFDGLVAHDIGVLVAPPGAGKDVIRTIHSVQRGDRLAANQNFISEQFGSSNGLHVSDA